MRKNVIVQKKSFHIRRGSVRKPKLTMAAKRERMQKIRFFLMVFFGVVIFGMFAYFFFFSPYAELRRISVQTEVSEEERDRVVQTLNEYLEGKKLFLFSHRNFFFFSEGDMREGIEKKFVFLTGVKVKKQFPDSLSISFEDRIPVAAWCGSDRCFMIDKDGYAFSEVEHANEVRQSVENARPMIVEENRSGAELCDTVASAESIARTILWDDFFRTRLGRTASGTYFVEPKNFEEYRIRTEKGWDIRVGKNIAIEDTMKALFAFLQTLPADRQAKLESIDMRIDGKIFFTEKKEESTEVKVRSTEGGQE